jgi:hypothetical protein
MYVASSTSSLFNYQRENISREAVLKRYALLYDNILFDRRGCPIGPGEIAETLADYVSLLICEGSTLEEMKILGKNKSFSSLFVDCWDVVDNAEKFNSEVFSTIDEDIQQRIGDFSHKEIRRINGLPEDSYDYDIDDVKEINGDLFIDIGINKLLLERGIEIVPSYSPIVGRALQNEYKYRGIECHSLFEEDVLVPDFDSLSWGEILDLREDKYLKAFRKVVFDIATSTNNVEPALVARVQSDLWNLVSDAKPNVARTFLTGILGNLPSPIVLNPIGVGAAIKDTYDAKKLEAKYGHVFFINNMRVRRK